MSKISTLMVEAVKKVDDADNVPLIIDTVMQSVTAGSERELLRETVAMLIGNVINNQRNSSIRRVPKSDDPPTGGGATQPATTFVDIDQPPVAPKFNNTKRESIRNGVFNERIKVASGHKFIKDLNYEDLLFAGNTRLTKGQEILARGSGYLDLAKELKEKNLKVVSELDEEHVRQTLNK